MACVLVMMAGGCSVKAPPQALEESIHSRDDIDVNEQQVRLRMRALVEPLSAAIVESADRIAAATDDPGVKRAALVWKIEAVPALREALFRSNPFSSILDSWVLAWQMTDYFETGDGRETLGDAAPAAVTTCRYLENEIRRVAASMTVSGDVSKAGDFARDWAREHRIRHSIAGRESTLSRVGEREIAEKMSTTAVAGNVVVTLDDLTLRMDILSAQLLEQSRWQAELFAMDLAAGYGLEKAMPLAETAVASTTETLNAVQQLLPAVEKTLAVAETAPDVIGREREAVVVAASQQLSRVLDFVREERVAIFEQVSNERKAILADVQRTIASERASTTAEVGQIGTGLVDHVMIRVAQLLGASLFAAFVGVVVLMFLARWMYFGRRAA